MTNPWAKAFNQSYAEGGSINSLIGKTDVLNVLQQKALIDAGAATPEDYGWKSANPKQDSSNYKSGTTAAQDAAKARGITINQLKDKQRADFNRLLKSRNYADGGSIKESPRNYLIGTIADLLSKGKSSLNQYNAPDILPLIGGQGLGDLLAGKIPEEVNEWSYGNSPLQIVGGGTGSLVPQLKQGRNQGVMDTLAILMPSAIGGLGHLATPTSTARRTLRNVDRVISKSDPVQSALEEIARHELPVERAAASSPRGWVGPVEIGDDTSVSRPLSGLFKASDEVHTHPRQSSGAYNPLSAADTPDGRNMHVAHANPETGTLTRYLESLSGDASPPTIPRKGMSQESYLDQLLNTEGYSSNVPRALYADQGMIYPGDLVEGKLNVIKNKGGNWLSGSVEDALKGLKKHEPIKQTLELQPELIKAYQQTNPKAFANSQQAARLNNWIDKPLTRYIKNEMATPEDPLRALAERGVLHTTPDWIPDGELSRRLADGMVRTPVLGGPGSRMGKTKLAQDWEDLTDQGLDQYVVRDAPSGHRAANPWMEKVDQNTPFYALPKGLEESLGFSHLIDELSNAINPESGLPRHLQFPADRLDKVSVPQAVERVDAINKWRAALKAEADAAKANNAATVLHKEYPHSETTPNPKGLKWVEIKPTGNTTVPEGYTVEPNSTYLGKTGYQLRTPNGDRLGLPQATEEAAFAELKDPRYVVDKELQDALKYEGDTMGHCVGGYCEDVASGKSRIYSLRDAKGQPHVTVEVEPYPGTPGRDVNGEIETPPNRIVQIKGKGNLKPADEYQPFVQDFVKSGKWSDVGDLQNTGLRRTSDAWNTTEMNRIKNAGIDIPEHMTQDEIDAIEKQVWAPEGFAQGGSVSPNKIETPEQLRAIILAIQSGR